MRAKAKSREQYIIKWVKGESVVHRERERYNCEIEEDQDIELNLAEIYGGGTTEVKGKVPPPPISSRGRRGRKPKNEAAEIDPMKIDLPP